MADGFQGAGYLDSEGNWIDVPGTGINGSDIPRPTATATPGSGDFTTISRGGPIAIRTPNSSTGQPAVQDLSASTYQPPATQTRSGLLTPNSRTGAPGLPIQSLPIGSGMLTGIGALNAFPTPTSEQMTERLNNPPMADDPWGLKAFSRLFGGQTAPASVATQPATAPVTQTGSGYAPSALAPPGGGSPPPPPSGVSPPLPPSLPPFLRGPIPAAMPQRAPAQRAGAPNLGYGAPAAGVPADLFAIHPSNAFTTIDRPNADIVGGPTRPGYLSADPHEPGGPARMGALDLSGLFSHPAIAAAAAQHPAVRAAVRQPVQGPLSALAPVRAQVQRQPANGLVGYGRVNQRALNRIGVQDVMGP